MTRYACDGLLNTVCEALISFSGQVKRLKSVLGMKMESSAVAAIVGFIVVAVQQ